MGMREELLAVCAKYQELTETTESSLSNKLFGAGHRLGEIVAGGDLRTQKCEEALHWLCVNWPRGHRGDWPRGARRIVKKPDHVEAD